MTRNMLILFASLVFSGAASAGLFDAIKENLGKVNETLDGVNQQVDDISQEVDDINNQVDDLNAEFDGIGKEFDEIQTKTGDLGKPSSRTGDTGQSAGKAIGQAGASTSSMLDASQLASDAYSFDVKRIKLGETFQSLKGKYPGAKMMGQNPASYLPDPANENLRVKMTGDANGSQYVSSIYLRQNLGASASSSCKSRVQTLESRLIKKYGSSAKKTVKNDADGTSYFISWMKTVPGSSKHSKLFSKATCSNDASGNLDFSVVAKGEYIEEFMKARRVNGRSRSTANQELEADF